MARCGCSGSACGCKLVAGKNSAVRGSGTLNNPYAVDSLPVSLTATGTASIILTVDGDGSVGTPWNISATVPATLFDTMWGMWSGTQAEYDALAGSRSDDVLYGVVD